MAAYLLILAAYVFDLLGFGVARHRSAVALGLVGLGLVVGWATAPEGYVGVAGAGATILACRYGVPWLGAGGYLVVLEVWHLVARAVVELLLSCAGAVAAVLSPRQPEALVLEQAPAVSWTGVPAVATDQMMRWTPAATPAAAPGLHSVETYSDWLPTGVDTCGGYNAAARYATDKYGVSRSTFARDLAAMRKEGKAA